MAALDWSQCPAVESAPGKVSGAWCSEVRACRCLEQPQRSRLGDERDSKANLTGVANLSSSPLRVGRYPCGPISRVRRATAFGQRPARVRRCQTLPAARRPTTKIGVACSGTRWAAFPSLIGSSARRSRPAWDAIAPRSSSEQGQPSSRERTNAGYVAEALTPHPLEPVG